MARDRSINDFEGVILKWWLVYRSCRAAEPPIFSRNKNYLKNKQT